MPNDFYRVSGAPQSMRWRLAADEVRTMLAALAPDEREAYERIAAPAAAPLLARAAAERTTEPLARIQELYGASSIGVEAAALLASIRISEGRFLDAAGVASEALRFAPRNTRLWWMLVDALEHAGERAVLEGLDPPGDLVVRRRSGETSVARLKQEALARLPRPAREDDWPMWGKTPARDGVAGSPSPLPDPLRWRAPVLIAERDLDSEPTRGYGADTSDLFWAQWERFRPFAPAVAERVVYLADGRTVQALDLYSGTRIWSFDDTSQSGLSLERAGARGRGRTNLERAFSPVVAGDLV
jgi:hypothetical protein